SRAASFQFGASHDVVALLPQRLFAATAAAEIGCADKAELKRAFCKLALQYHPDVNSDPGAADTFIQLSNAYEVSVRSHLWPRMPRYPHATHAPASQILTATVCVPELNRCHHNQRSLNAAHSPTRLHPVCSLLLLLPLPSALCRLALPPSLSLPPSSISPVRHGWGMGGASGVRGRRLTHGSTSEKRVGYGWSPHLTQPQCCTAQPLTRQPSLATWQDAQGRCEAGSSSQVVVRQRE
ncbi:unnamed protein product, partial [Closterium sp. NIES-54]